MSNQGTAAQQHDPAGSEAPSAQSLASEISLRVGAILDAVEREATRLRDEARADAAVYLEDARRRADSLVEQRRLRIAELSDELVAKSEAVVSRLEDAEPVRSGFENLVRALGDAAERLVEAEDTTAAPPEPTRPAAGGSFREQRIDARPPSPTGFAQARGVTWRELGGERAQRTGTDG
jgi:hypothetical protein